MESVPWWERARIHTTCQALLPDALFQYGQRFTPNMQLVEDVIQDLLVHLWLHRGTINDTASVKFYLIKAFRHRMLKTIKTALRRNRTNRTVPRSDVRVFQRRKLDQPGKLIWHLKKRYKQRLTNCPHASRKLFTSAFSKTSCRKRSRICWLLMRNPLAILSIKLSNLRARWQSPPSISILFYSFYQILS